MPGMVCIENPRDCMGRVDEADRMSIIRFLDLLAFASSPHPGQWHISQTSLTFCLQTLNCAAFVLTGKILDSKSLFELAMVENLA